MDTTRTCQRCGASLSAYASAGLCPACLLRSGLASDADDAPDLTAPTRHESASRITHHASRTVRYFGDYELLEEIARGGMGVVYKARQVSLNRIVAVKMILAGQLASGADVQRFRAEAEAAANLKHPNIVAIHEVGEHEGQHYFSMDFIEGQSLAALVRDGPLPALRAARYVQIIAEAIHYAHQRGTLHRDLKPSNVLLDVHNQPQVTDFGLAKRVEGRSELRVVSEKVAPVPVSQLSLSTPDPLNALTLTGQVLGSPNYMSPEQAAAQHDKIGPHSDTYSLGALLYHLLAGQPPFLAGSVHATLEQVIRNNPVALRALSPGVPRDLETICLKCLEKESPRRYPSARHLAEELGRVLSGEPIHARPAGPAERALKWARRRPALAALAAVSFGAIVTVLLLVLTYDARLRQKSDYALARSNEALEQADLARNRLYAFQIVRAVAGWRQYPDRSAALLQETNACPVDLRDFAWRFFESLCRPRDRFTFRFERGLTPGFAPGLGKVLDISSDGKIAAAAAGYDIKLWDSSTDKGAIWELDVATGQELREWEYPDVAAVNAAIAPAKLLANTTVAGAITLWELSLPPPSLVPPGHQSPVLGAAFSPDGRRLVSVGGRLNKPGEICIHDGGSWKPQDHWNGHSNVASCVGFAPDGHSFATGGWDGTVKVWDATNRALLHKISAPAQTVTSVSYSPDGATLAIAASLMVDLYDMRSRAVRAQLTGQSGEILCAAFSPRDAILATAGSDPTVRLWGGKSALLEKSLTGPRGPIRAAAFSRDGKWLAAGGDDSTIWLWDTDAEELRFRLIGHEQSIRALAFSPDGKTLATASADKTIKLWNVRAGQELATLRGSSDALSTAVFSPTGNAVVSGSGAGLRIWQASSH